MLMLWFGLLVGCVLFGSALVGALVLPRTVSPLAAGAGLFGLFGAVSAMGAIGTHYRTPEATAAGVIVFLAGITSGYAIAATALPYFARRGRPTRTGPRRTEPDDNPRGGEAVILVCCAEPERYSARAIAVRQNLLADSAGIDVPPTALPFVFFAEKARYRAAGGVAPGPTVARRLAERVSEVKHGTHRTVELAWCHAPETLATQVDLLAAAGEDSPAVVILGMPESGWIDEMRRMLDGSTHTGSPAGPIFSASVWNDRLLPIRLVERIMASTAGVGPEDVGVVLVGEGFPAQWEQRYPAATSTENYFNQRIRMLLGEAGVDERNVRVAWLNWQAPDVTEAVRHVAALGCTRIVVAPSTIALPTLETVLDLDHAVALARVPEDVQVVTLVPWGDDDGFADAVRRSANEALAHRADD